MSYRESLKTSFFRDLPLKTAFAERFGEQMQGRRKNAPEFLEAPYSQNAPLFVTHVLRFC
jgi:hypothetical protein